MPFQTKEIVEAFHFYAIVTDSVPNLQQNKKVMNDLAIQVPVSYPAIQQQTEAIGFTMPSDQQSGALLRTLAASKPGGRILDLGTGTGLSLSWLLEGMDKTSSIISLDIDPEVSGIAQGILGSDSRATILCEDGDEWLANYKGPGFDLIFADAWPGKYSQLDKTLSLLNPGAFYVIDDMDPQENWPEGHLPKSEALVATLEAREDLMVVKLNWSTGLMLCVKQ